MPRWKNRHDANHLEIYKALYDAYCHPIHGKDSDIYARHRDGYGVMIEIKTAKGRMRPLQRELAALFQDRYHVARTTKDALKACGIE